MLKVTEEQPKKIARNLLRRLPFEDDHLVLLADEAYQVLAQYIKDLRPEVEIYNIPFCDLPQDAAVLLLAEPESYLKYQLFRHLDFASGEPRIPGRPSRVYIFPKDSLCHIFSVDPEQDLRRRNSLLEMLEPSQQYRITAPGGTDLTFTARQWIGLDFEVCTAPIEDSVQGVIAVDGALFFQKTKETLLFYIENGRLSSIQAAAPSGEKLLEKYREMTAEAFRDPVNLQLAEIGIGFCQGAWISDCFMEAEAADRTCHFCFGNNVCYGGENESEFHGASVLIKEPIFDKIITKDLFRNQTNQ